MTIFVISAWLKSVDNYVEIGDFLKKEDVIYFLQEKCQKKFAFFVSKKSKMMRIIYKGYVNIR